MHTCETQVNVVKYRGIHRIVALVKVFTAEVVTDPLLAQAPVSKSSRTPCYSLPLSCLLLVCALSLSALPVGFSASVFLCAFSVRSLLLTISSLQRLASLSESWHLIRLSLLSVGTDVGLNKPILLASDFHVNHTLTGTNSHVFCSSDTRVQRCD
eukprot:SAG31_NODE_2306_length_5969_cov_104.526065_3_plen_155_part_00